MVPELLPVGGSLVREGTMAGATDAEDLGYTTVWEAFTLSECADVTFNWCGSSTDELMYSFELVTGDCDDPDSWNSSYPSLTLSDCGDGNTLTTAYTLEAGTYYVMIYAGPIDTYTLEMSAASCAPPPANDHCSNVVPEALPIGGTLTFIGDFTSATADGDFDASFPSDQGVKTVWHTFTTTECANITVRYCNMDVPYDSYWTFLATSCPADSTVILGSYDRQQCSNGDVTIQYWDLPAGTYYLPVGDLAGVAWPYRVEVQATACGPYCAAWALNTIAFYEKISQVSFGGIARPSTLGLGYESFLEDTAHVVRGGSYPITVTLSNGYPGDQVLGWIDFNGDNMFQSEELVLSTELSAGPYTDTIIIPANAVIGTTRMRIRMHDAGHPDWANDQPCGMATFGQVEDYSVNIGLAQGIHATAPDRFTLTPNPATDQVTIAFGTGTSPVRLALHDATGRTLYEKAVRATNGTITMDLGHMASGLYLLQATYTDGTQTVQRLVKR